MDTSDQNMRFLLLQGRIATEIRNSNPGLARRLLELELERSAIVDSSINDISSFSSANVYDKPYIERKPNFKKIQKNFETSFELVKFEKIINEFRNNNKMKIESWNSHMAQLKNSSLKNQNEQSSLTIPENNYKNRTCAKRPSCSDNDYSESSLRERIISDVNTIKKIKLDDEPIQPKKPFGSALDLFIENQVLNKKMSSSCAEEFLENKNLLKKKKNSNSLEDESLKQFDSKIVEQIKASIPDKLDNIGWDSIAGLEDAKKKIQQVAILPLIRPEFFTGIRKPPKGILLFGPPGTGKTMIGKCIAAQAKAKFFSITAASITSKWMGESEKTMKTLFAVARLMKPSVIFVDEIDSLLTTRSSGENDCTIRVKTEFLSQFNGLESDDGDQLLVIGTTNRPEELDRAVLRRFSVRLLISLPNKNGRKQMLMSHLKDIKNTLTDNEIDDISEKTDGYVGSDMFHLAQAAAMMPIDHMDQDEFLAMKVDDIRPVSHDDFCKAISQVPPSFDKKHLDPYLEWNRQYGTNFN